MDIQRTGVARSRRIRQVTYGAIAGAAVLLITLGLSRLEPAAPTVERSTVWVDTVKRGSMLRQVRGSGTLVPVEVRWIPARTDGRVERRVALPGTPVKANSIILELSNPQLDQEALDAEMALRRSEAEYSDLRVRVERELMAQQASAAQIESEYIEAELTAERDEQLAESGLVSDLNQRISRARADSLATRDQLEKKRLSIMDESIEAQLEAKRAEVEQRRALYELRRQQVEELQVRAGIDGMLQRVPVEVGQQVTPGTNLAQVADPTNLKAEVRIPATQARDIQLRQPAKIDTRNGIVPGYVIRIDPAVQDGTVTVDVTLDGPLPPGARPDLNVDGTVELERLEEVLYVGRPAFGQEKSTVGLFKLTEDGRYAERIQVSLGRSSVNTIEVLDGLQEADQVILSDMSAHDAHDRVRLN
jgi:HlyD family secretion protein